MLHHVGMSRSADPNAKISLLNAAEAVFAEHGLDAAKVEEIARRAGLSKGAFYLHFVSKEEAFKQVVESFLARCKKLCLPPQEYRELPATAEEMIDFWLEQDTQMFELLWQNRAIVSILATCTGEYTYLSENFRETVMHTTCDWVRLLQREGYARRELEADLVAALIWGAYSALSYRMLTFARKPPIHDWLVQTVSVFFRGIGTPKFLVALEKLENPRPSLAEQRQLDRRVTHDAEIEPRSAKHRARAKV